MLRIGSAIFLLFFIVGCSTKADVEMAKLHYQSQQVEKKPIVLMEAHEGQTIQLTGVKTFAVYDQSQQATVRQYQKTYHPAWSILGSAVQIALPIYAQGYSMYKLADVVGKHAGGNWSNTGEYREGSANIDVSGRVNSNDDISGRVNSNDDISGRVASNDDISGRVSSNDDISGRVSSNDDISGRVASNDDISGRVSSNDDISGRVSSNDDISGRVNSNDDYTHDPTVVEQPAPVIVAPADPIVVTQPEPIIVTQPEPIIVP